MAEKYIRMHGRLIAVTDEVHYAYYHMSRQSRTQREKDRRHHTVSYDALDTADGLGIELLADEETPTVEEIVMLRILTEKLHHCLAQLPEQDQKLLHAIFFEGLSERELAKQAGIHYMTIHDRKTRAIKKLRKLMDQ